MSEEHAPSAKSGDKKIPIWNWYFYNKGVEIWNKSFGPKYGMFNPITREGKPQASAVLQENQDLFRLNDGKINLLSDIENRWGVIETMLFGDDKFHFAKDKFNDAVFSDRYRTIEYFRDPDLTMEETLIFKQKGTVELEDLKVSIDKDKAIRNAQQTKKEKEAEIARLRGDPKEAAKLSDAELILQKTDEFLNNPDGYIAQVSILPKIKIDEVIIPFINGKPERIVAIGPQNMTKIIGDFNALNTGIDHFASSSGLPASVRTPINQLMQEILKSFETLSKIETDHGKKVEKIQKIIISLMSETGGVGVVEQNRPNKNWIRFSHTYKIIKPHKVKKIKDASGKEKSIMVYFKKEYAGFNRGDELEPGKDENGWPLEVYEDHGKWYVLLDKWWSELSENDWHEKVIKGKSGGVKKWTEKIINGVKKTNRYTKTYRTNGCHVREVPKEWVGDNLHNISESGVGDIDPLDKISFISNETDAFRDDFRDGRFHSNSKSSMDYIIAGRDGILPSKPINFKINTEDPEVRIKFRPIYYTSQNAPKTELIGELNPNGGLPNNMNRIIHDDERKVSRKYEMDTDFGKLTNQVRSPRHLNPAFDRAAIEHTYIHWGRMLYYETTDGITRWSENPFPHVSTRGLSKYIINLVLKKSFSFNEAREILKGKKWDYGIRHYGEPFTIDPLGPGGVLEHARVQAQKSGGGH